MSNTIDTSSVSSTSLTSGIDSSTSLQFMYAQLQLNQSQQCKKNAMTIMKQIENSQQEQKEVAEMIAKARDLQQKAKDGKGDCSGDSKASYMPKEMQDWMDARGIKYDTKGNDNRHNVDEWEYNIKSLTNYQDTLGTDTQTKMVYLQDYISQYNNYLTGASTQIDNCMQTMRSILSK